MLRQQLWASTRGTAELGPGLHGGRGWDTDRCTEGNPAVSVTTENTEGGSSTLHEQPTHLIICFYALQAHHTETAPAPKRWDWSDSGQNKIKVGCKRNCAAFN